MLFSQNVTKLSVKDRLGFVSKPVTPATEKVREYIVLPSSCIQFQNNYFYNENLCVNIQFISEV